MVDLLIPAIVVLPMIGFLVTAVIGRRLDKQAHIVPVGVVVIAWLFAMVVVVMALSHAAPFNDEAAGFGYTIPVYTWIPAGDFQVNLSFHVDALTACLLIVVTTIGMLVHIYSIGYMSHDAGYWRFFAYLNLFMFSMLLLVLADSFLVIFVAWELVGLSSYLLIGFWKHKRTAALAAKKAFLVNRVGDVGFALGIMLIFVSMGTLTSTTSTVRRASSRRSAASTRSSSPRSRCSSSPGRWARAPSSRSTSGCPTRWRARRRCRP